MVVSSGKEVSIEYTLRLEDTSVVDSNKGEEPLTYIHGNQEIVLGLESALEGMQAGETKEVTVPPERAYGVIDAAEFREVEMSALPEGARQVGSRLRGRDEEGNIVHLRVAQVKDGTVVIDFNHPLAGKTLFFEVRVVDVRQGPTQ